MITEDFPVLLRPSTRVMGDESDLTLSISASLSKKSLLEDLGAGSNSKATTPRSYFYP